MPALLADLARTRSALSVRAFASAVIPLGRLKLEPGLRYAEYFEAGRRARRVRAPARGAAGAHARAQRRRHRRPLLADAQPARRRRRLRGVRPRRSRPADVDAGGAGRRVTLARRPVTALTGFYQWLYVSDMRSTFDHDDHRARVPRDAARPRLRRELMLRLPEHARVSGWLAYTLSWSLRDFDGLFAPSDWDQRHILNLVTTVRLKDGFSVGRPLPLQHRASLSGQARRIRAAAGVLADRSARGQAVRPRPQHVGPLPRARKRDVQPAGDRARARWTDANASEPVGFRIVLPSIGVHVEW